MGQLFGDSGAVCIQEQTQLRRAFAQLLFKFGATQGGFGHMKIPPEESSLV
jgi:hypothetical protein